MEGSTKLGQRYPLAEHRWVNQYRLSLPRRRRSLRQIHALGFCHDLRKHVAGRNLSHRLAATRASDALVAHSFSQDGTAFGGGIQRADDFMGRISGSEIGKDA